jgi:hypothetical protein
MKEERGSAPPDCLASLALHGAQPLRDNICPVRFIHMGFFSTPLRPSYVAAICTTAQKAGINTKMLLA